MDSNLLPVNLMSVILGEAEEELWVGEQARQTKVSTRASTLLVPASLRRGLDYMHIQDQ